MKYAVQDIGAARGSVSWILMQGDASQHTCRFSCRYCCHDVPIIALECLCPILPRMGIVTGWVQHRKTGRERRQNQSRWAKSPMNIDRKLLVGSKRFSCHGRRQKRKWIQWLAAG